MREIAIDIETYSSEDLSACGVYRYAAAPDFRVLLMAYSIDGGQVQVCDLEGGEELPEGVREAILRPDVVKTAWNAAFERVCLSRLLGLPRGEMLPPESWSCSMVMAARLGLPLSLGQCAQVLGLKEGKMAQGRALIRLFSTPDRRGERRTPQTEPEKWETFKAYCRRDVEVEQAIRARLCGMPVPEWEQRLYVADQEINDRGVLIDSQMVASAVAIDREICASLLREMQQLTGLDNPNSTAQLKSWLRRETGAVFGTLSKGSLDEIEEQLKYFPRARRVLALRRELGKTSNKKYEAMLQSVGPDGRIRGLLQFCGAARTGRWAGRLVQVQNLPQNHLPDLDRAREIVRGGDREELELCYPNPRGVLSELIRTAFVAPQGRRLHVCDFSAIEARVVAWLAGETWALDVFRGGGDLYCATASQMFGVPVEKHGENSHLRQKGKIAVLALGYGGGVKALEAMGGARMGLSEEEMTEIVHRWRRANPRIVKMWRVLEGAARAALQGGEVTVHRGLHFYRRRGGLCVELPSGRVLFYPRARVGEGDEIEYEGVDQTSRSWGVQRTYGGKLTENAVQAIARDILGAVILRARRRGLEIVFHIHDEIVVEATPGQTLAEVEALFSQPISWCADLPLRGTGYTTPYYKKD